jgi:hypothetical protein
MNKENLYMVFDVESVGLHGEGFAVGWVVVNGDGKEIQYGLSWCPPTADMGDDVGLDWVSHNVPELPSNFSRGTVQEVRKCFWEQWSRWKERGAVLVADCAWPVEARFLAACVDDSKGEREWQGPYPLHELASIFSATGKNPLEKFERRENELPKHNPLADARQSARLLFDSLAMLNHAHSPVTNNPQEDAFYEKVDAIAK